MGPEQISRQRRPRGDGSATFTSSGESPSRIITMTSSSSSCTTAAHHCQKTRSAQKIKSSLPKSRLSRQPVPLNDPALMCCSASTSSCNDFTLGDTAKVNDQKSSPSSSFIREDVLDRLAAMQLQESTKPYIVCDYFNISSHDEKEDDDERSDDEDSCSKENQHKQHHRVAESASGSSAPIPNGQPAATKKKKKKRSSFSQPQPTDVTCREKMVVWTIQVVDYCQLNRHTAEIAVRMFDRLLSLAKNRDCRYQHRQLAQSCLQDRKTYQLAAMTCLYTSIKLNETQVMSPDIVASLSRGMSTADQVVEMESRILAALGFHICGPTGIDVVDHFVQLLPTTVPPHVKRTIIERSRYAIHQSLLDYELSTTAPPTLLGYAALVHTLDGLDEWTRTQYVDRDAIVTDITLVLFAQKGTIDEDLVVWSIDRINDVVGDGDIANKSRRPPTSSSSNSNKTKSSDRPSLASSQNSKRRESINGTSPKTVINQPPAPAEVTP